MNKKINLLIFLVLFVSLSGVLNAQVEVRTLFEGAFLPFQYFGLPEDGEFGYDKPGFFPNGRTGVYRAGFGRSDGLGSFVAGADFIGKSSTENIGVHLQLRYRPSEDFLMAAGDQLKIWWKPIDMLQIDVGKFVQPIIRSKIIPPHYFHFYLPIGNENSVFHRLEGTGMLLQLTPLPQLYFAAVIKADETLGFINNAEGLTVTRPLVGQEEAKYLFERTQVSAAYTFGDIGMFRVQYFGRNASVRENENEINDQIGRQGLNSEIFQIQSPRFEAAFNLTAVPNLTFDIGGKFPLPLSNIEKKPEAIGELPLEINGNFQEPYTVSFGTRYVLDDLSFNILAAGKFGGWLQYEESAASKGKKWDIGPELQAVVWVNYKVTPNFTAQVDFGTVLNFDTYYDNELAIKGGMLLGGGIFGLFHIYGNNNWIRTGLSFSTGTLSGNQKPVYGADPSADKWFTIFSVPIIFHVEL